MRLTTEAPSESAAGQGRQPGESSPAGSFVSALAWTSGAKWAAQVLSWGTTVVVARILTPNDYGLVGMATLVMGVVTLVAELGISTSVVTERVQEPSTLRQLNAIAVLVGLGSFVSVSAAAPSLARFFNSEQLVPVVSVLGATFIVQSVKTVPEGLLLQHREFRLLAGVEAARAVLGALVTVASALAGWGYWALVAGYVANAVSGTALILSLRPLWLERPRRDVVGPVIRVSLHVVGSRLAWYCYSNADFLVAGRVLGSAPLGIYTMGWTIATAPVDKIAATLNSVSQSFFASSRNDVEDLRGQFLRVTKGIALVTTPACLGIALVADDLVGAVLGPRWSAVVVPLRILCIYTPLRCIAVVLPPLLLVLRESRYLLLCTAGAAVGLPFCFLFGSSWGAGGIAAAWAVAYPLVAFPLYERSLPRIGVSAIQYASALREALWPTAGMAVGVLLLRRVLPLDWHSGLRLTCQVAFGIAVWLGTLLVLSRSTAREILRLARQFTGRGSSGVS
jgi:O-antigen/teichoic acid export membrane protein